MDTNETLVKAVQDGIREGVKQKLVGYNSPLDSLIVSVLKDHDAHLRGILTAAVGAAVKDATFIQQIADQVRHKLATVLVSRFGGERARQVNQLKSDPATRARITLAIEEIVKERVATTV